MEKTQLGNLSAELTTLQNSENYVRNRYKEIAMQLLKEHFNGECCFRTEEDIDNDEYNGCPSILSQTMVKDSDPADCYVTRMYIGEDEKIYLDLYAYYLGKESYDVNAEWEGPLDWGEVAHCLIAAA